MAPRKYSRTAENSKNRPKDSRRGNYLMLRVHFHQHMRYVWIGGRREETRRITRVRKTRSSCQCNAPAPPQPGECKYHNLQVVVVAWSAYFQSQKHALTPCILPFWHRALCHLYILNKHEGGRGMGPRTNPNGGLHLFCMEDWGQESYQLQGKGGKTLSKKSKTHCLRGLSGTLGN